MRLARLARAAGMDGVVASPLEIARIRRAGRPGFLIVTPGIRPPSAAIGRSEARHDARGGDARRRRLLVVGGPIRDAADPVAAAREVVADMARGLLTSRARTHP